MCINQDYTAFPEWLPDFFYFNRVKKSLKMDDRMFGVPCPECGKGTIEPVRYQNYKTNFWFEWVKNLACHKWRLTKRRQSAKVGLVL